MAKQPGFTVTLVELVSGTLRVAVHRLRTRYRELLRLEIVGTLESELEVESEMRHLFKVLARK